MSELDMRPFPMQDGPPIPWFLAEAIHKHLYRYSQSVGRIAERGGFGWGEVAVLGKQNSTSEQRAACQVEVREMLLAAASTEGGEG